MWLSTFGTIGLLVTEGHVSSELFLFAVGGLGSAVAGMAGVLYKRLLSENADLKTENAELRQRLDAYGSLAPDIVAEVRAMLGPLPPPPSSNVSTDLPYPYGPSRPTRPRRRVSGDRS